MVARTPHECSGKPKTDDDDDDDDDEDNDNDEYYEDKIKITWRQWRWYACLFHGVGDFTFFQILKETLIAA